MEELKVQVSRWLRQAEHDLEIASKLTTLDAFDHAAFLAQQSAEKVLKACWIINRNEAPPRTHDLVRIAIELAAPSDIVNVARIMAGDYMATRYPDIAEEIPADSYTRDDAEIRLAAARSVYDWGKKQIG